MKALIVDDDRTLADVVAFALHRAGFQVIQAYDGFLALQHWIEEKPDLIILGSALAQHRKHRTEQRIVG